METKDKDLEIFLEKYKRLEAIVNELEDLVHKKKEFLQEPSSEETKRCIKKVILLEDEFNKLAPEVEKQMKVISKILPA